jgi:hypothetical protein
MLELNGFEVTELFATDSMPQSAAMTIRFTAFSQLQDLSRRAESS